MIERVARAIANRHMPGVPVGLKRYEPLARAAIKAMREPTKEMLDAGFKCHRQYKPIAQMWEAMIDKALEDG